VPVTGKAVPVAGGDGPVASGAVPITSGPVQSHCWGGGSYSWFSCTVAVGAVL
jgi:hypothetical protein